MSNYYVYILECSDKTFYTGFTRDIEKRVREHNNGRNGAKYTRSRRPVRLVYVETYLTLSDALKGEVMIKRMSKARKISLIEEYIPDE